MEEEEAWLGRLRQGECLRENLREYLGEPSRAEKAKSDDEYEHGGNGKGIILLWACGTLPR
jgi:hypothetical protein